MVYLHVDSRVCKVPELLVTKTQTHTNTKELRKLDDEAEVHVCAQTTTGWLKGFCIYRLKCSKAIHKWMG